MKFPPSGVVKHEIGGSEKEISESRKRATHFHNIAISISP
jgi:hypothetical protein